MFTHARMRRLVWSGDGTMAGARQNMRVRIPSNFIHSAEIEILPSCIYIASIGRSHMESKSS